MSSITFYRLFEDSRKQEEYQGNPRAEMRFHNTAMYLLTPPKLSKMRRSKMLRLRLETPLHCSLLLLPKAPLFHPNHHNYLQDDDEEEKAE